MFVDDLERYNPLLKVQHTVSDLEAQSFRTGKEGTLIQDGELVGAC